MRDNRAIVKEAVTLENFHLGATMIKNHAGKVIPVAWNKRSFVTKEKMGSERFMAANSQQIIRRCLFGQMQIFLSEKEF
jgi:hypothetical protein